MDVSWPNNCGADDDGWCFGCTMIECMVCLSSEMSVLWYASAFRERALSVYGMRLAVMSGNLSVQVVN